MGISTSPYTYLQALFHKHDRETEADGLFLIIHLFF